MLVIRNANRNDEKQILNLLKELDIYYPSLQLKGFWVAERDGEILGVVQLKEQADFIFLSCLATRQKYQGQGIAKRLLNETLGRFFKNIYLYTIIPEFFKIFGFQAVDRPPRDLPSKERYECEFCHPEKCICMVKSQ